MAPSSKNKAADREIYLQFNRPGNTCLLCSTPLNIEGHHPSLIELSEKEEVVRKDFCPGCWQRMAEKGYFSFWVTKRVTAQSATERRLAKADRNIALWRLFNALYETDNSEFDPQLFLLAHLLMQYRVLLFSGSGKEGTLKFTHQKLGETFEITDLPLDAVDFVTIKSELEQQAINYAPSVQDEQLEVAAAEAS
jgi:hypothetical protein